MKKALITGITGQDGSYLAELLLSKGYEVHGIVRPTAKFDRIASLQKDTSLLLHRGDLADSNGLNTIIGLVQPDEVYNLGTLSHTKDFFDLPEYTADIAALGTLRLLEAIKSHCPAARFFQAGSSELFGNAKETPQTEKTLFAPRSLYGIAKLYAFWAVSHYRDAHQMFACNGILFNHESPRRNETFVSRKITRAAVRIQAGLQEKLLIGNLDARRDWGYAKDFVEGMWRMLQQKAPEDFVLATGKATTVRQFVELAFLLVGIHIAWSGTGIHEKGTNQATGKIIIEISPEFFRHEDCVLEGDPSKIKQKLGWIHQTSLAELVRLMIQADREELDHVLNKKGEL